MSVIEFADWTVDVDILGNVGFRIVTLQGKQRLPGHQHNFPHATVLVRGKVAVEFAYPDYVKMEVFEAPARFEVPAEVGHTVTALSEHGAEIWCVFGVRGEDGQIMDAVTPEARKDRFWHERLGGG